MRHSTKLLLGGALLLLACSDWTAQAQTAQEFWQCRPPSAGVDAGWCPISTVNPLPVTATVSASVTGFTPNGNYATPLAVTTSSANVALPTGGSVLVSNTGANTAYVNLGTSGAVTATTSNIAIPAGANVGITVGSNTFLAAITASSTATLNIAGGAGLVAGYGGGSSGSSAANASVSATGSAVPGSATYVGMLVGGNLTGLPGSATGVKTDGTGFTQPVSQGTASNLNATVVGTGTAGTPAGGVMSVQGVASGTPMPVSSGVAQGSTTSGQTVSPIGCRTLTAAPTDTTAQTNIPWCRTDGALASDTASINGTAVLAGTGAVGAGAQRVAVAVDSATVAGSASLPAGSNTIGGVNLVSSATGGATSFTLTAAASTNATSVKGSAGTLYHIGVYNNSATLAWVSFYNTAGTPTCGTGIVYQTMIPANSTSGAGAVEDFADGLNFTTGIGICVATGIAGTGSVSGTSYVVGLGYK